MIDKGIRKRDRIIVELLFNSYPIYRSAEDLCLEFGKMHRKCKSVKNSRAMGQLLRKFDILSSTVVVQHREGYNSVCRYQLMYRLKEIDYKNLQVYEGKPTDEIMSSLLK
jgi:hypothetical protein